MEESPLQNYKARQTALLGMLFALSMALSFLESMLTPFFGLMPAMKLGLSNIVVMYAVLFLNRRSALYLVLLKALFALLTSPVYFCKTTILSFISIKFPVFSQADRKV